MTESEWLACASPGLMLRALETLRPEASSRKLRLFACACVRTVWHLLTDERSRNAVLVAERFADGVATVRELQAAQDEAQAAARDASAVWDASLTASWAAVHASSWAVPRSAPQTVTWNTAQAVARAALWAALRDVTWDTAQAVARGALWAAVRDAAQYTVWTASRATQCDLLRDIIGNPFRQVAVDPSWLTPTVVRLAGGIYEGREFDCLPILGDALEDAGCTDEAILAHCREPGPHARGCWVVDLIQGRG